MQWFWGTRVQWGLFCVLMTCGDYLVTGAPAVFRWVIIYGVGLIAGLVEKELTGGRPSLWYLAGKEILHWACFVVVTLALIFMTLRGIGGASILIPFFLYWWGVTSKALGAMGSEERPRNGLKKHVALLLKCGVALVALAAAITTTVLAVIALKR